jgi:hypothetical protein
VSSSNPSSVWSSLALLVGVGVVVVAWGVRQSSGLGWLMAAQVFLVVPWFAPLLLPVVFHLTRRDAASSRLLRLLLVAAAGCVLLSAITPDSTDQADCFLGACNDSTLPDPWWWQIDAVWALPTIVLVVAFVALALEVGAVAVAMRVRGRARHPSPIAVSR